MHEGVFRDAQGRSAAQVRVFDRYNLKVRSERIGHDNLNTGRETSKLKGQVNDDVQ